MCPAQDRRSREPTHCGPDDVVFEYATGIRVAPSGIHGFSICICRGLQLTERRECVRKIGKKGRRESETKCTQSILNKHGNMKSTDTAQATD